MRILTSSLFSVFLAALCASPLAAAPYKIDGAHSQVMFKVKHLGISSVTGRFDSFEGKIDFDPAKVSAASVQATVDVASINTNLAKRDGHLKTCEFFCVEKFQKMTYSSKKVNDLGGGKFEIIGDLTLHGITKEVPLQAEFGGAAVSGDGKEHAAFTATAAISRKEFGLTWNKLTETGGILVGDEVKITLEIEAVKEA